MSCLATICLYGALSAGWHNAEPVEVQHTERSTTTHQLESPLGFSSSWSETENTVTVSTFEAPNSLQLPSPTGRAVLGLEHRSGIFIEAGHVSSLATSEDRGFEFVEVGIRKTFASW